MFTEIRNDYYNEDKECYYVDGWLTANDNEEGKTLANVYKDRIVYTDKTYSNIESVREAAYEIAEDKSIKEYYRLYCSEQLLIDSNDMNSILRAKDGIKLIFGKDVWEQIYLELCAKVRNEIINIDKLVMLKAHKNLESVCIYVFDKKPNNEFMMAYKDYDNNLYIEVKKDII